MRASPLEEPSAQTTWEHVSYSAFERHAVRRQRQRPQANTGRGEDRVPDRRRDSDDRGFPGAGGWQIRAVDQDGLDTRNIGEARHAVAGEAIGANLPVRKVNRLEQRAADPLDDSALDLVP